MMTLIGGSIISGISRMSNDMTPEFMKLLLPPALTTTQTVANTDIHTDIYTGWAKKSKPDNFSITLSTASQFS